MKNIEKVSSEILKESSSKIINKRKKNLVLHLNKSEKLIEDLFSSLEKLNVESKNINVELFNSGEPENEELKVISSNINNNVIYTLKKVNDYLDKSKSRIMKL